MRVYVSGDVLVCVDFPYPKFELLVRRHLHPNFLNLFKVLTERKYLVFKKYTLTLHIYFSLELFITLRYLSIYDSSFEGWAVEVAKHSPIIRHLTANHPPKFFDHTVLKQHNISLLPHQEKFVESYIHLTSQLNLRGMVLAFEQGLGKTLTAISTMLGRRVPKVLILCPKSLVPVWTSELVEKAHVPEEEVGTLETLTPSTKWLVVNFEKVNSIPPSFFPHNEWGLIVDEAHYIRNLTAKRTQQTYTLVTTHKPSDVLLLTGTPIKGEIDEWIPYLLILDPYLTPNVAKMYVRIVLNHPKLAKLIASFRMKKYIYRATKGEVLKLPPKHITELSVKVSNPQKYYWERVRELLREKLAETEREFWGKYKRLHNRLIEWLRSKGWIEEDITKLNQAIAKGDTHDVKLIQQQLLPQIDDKELKEYVKKLHTITNHFRLHVMGYLLGNLLVKLRAECVKEIVDYNKQTFYNIITNTPNKVIVSGSIVEGLKHFVEVFEREYNIKCVLVTGESTGEERKSLIKQFKQDPTVKVLVGSVGVIGVGLTLIEADTMIILNLPWRWADVEQLMDRVHRIGQTKEVYIYICELKTGSHLNVHSHMVEIARASKQFVEEQLSALLGSSSRE